MGAKFRPHSKRLIGNPLWRKREGERERGEREGGAVRRVVDTRYEKRIEWERESRTEAMQPSSLSVSSSEPAHEMPNRTIAPNMRYSK